MAGVTSHFSSGGADSEDADRPSPLIGRDAEIARLRGLVEPVPRHSQVLNVVGEAGMGKSALIADTARRARSAGMRVLSVSGRETETALGFAGLHQLLRPLLDRVDRLPPFEQADDRPEDAAVGRLVEVGRRADLDGGRGGVARKQHRTEERLFRLQIVWRDPRSAAGPTPLRSGPEVAGTIVEGLDHGLATLRDTAWGT